MRYEFIKHAITVGFAYGFAAYCLYLSQLVAISVFLIVMVICLLNKKQMDMLISKSMRDSFERFLEILASYVAIPGNFMHAFTKALAEHEKIYPKDILNCAAKKAYIKCSANIPSDKILTSFAKDINIQEGYLFCESLVICEKKGGDINRTIRETIAFIKEKTGIEHEIETITAEKRIERIIISICPFGILALLNSMGTGYLDVLYEGLLGRTIMTIAGVLFLISSYIAKKILEVRI